MSSLLGSLLGERVRIFEIPEPLQSYIQAKGRSSYSNLWFLPLVLPVFIMNPREYPAPGELPYKESLLESGDLGTAKTAEFTPVPAGEVWEVTKLIAQVSGADNITIWVWRGTLKIFDYFENKVTIDWEGKLYLKEADKVYMTSAVNNFARAECFGVKRYA